MSTTWPRVVQVALDQPPNVVAELDATLPPEECNGSPADRVARAATRDVLGGALGLEPEAIEISRVCVWCGHPSHGKPFVVGGGVSFSMSHSADLALVAIGDEGMQLGVDLEQVRTRVRLTQLAGRVCSPAELAAWLALPDAEQLPAFIELWTAKEAYLKAVGRGVTTSLAAVPSSPVGWSVVPVVVPDGYRATLAIDRPAVEFLVEEWTFTPNGGTAD